MSLGGLFMFIVAVLLILLILINAFFAASEIAFISLNDTKVKRMAEEGDHKSKKIFYLISEPGRFLSTIQIGITLVGFFASAFAADVFARPLATALFQIGIPLPIDILRTISVIVITLILSYFTLVFGELVPKQLAMHKTKEIAHFAVTPLTWLFKLFYPLVKLLNFSTNQIVKLLGIDPKAKPEEITEEEIRMMIEIGSEKGTIEKDEKIMITNVFEFNDKTVADIITHRTNLATLSIDATFQEAVQLATLKKFSRFPVYDETIDNIVGILHAKDLLHLFTNQNEKAFHLKDIIREPYFIMETQRVDTLFKEMQRNNVHIAIVLDEYGGTKGIITVEDVIEEIVGEIDSESNCIKLADKEIKKIAPNQYSFEGTVHLLDVENTLKIKLPTKQFNTLNSFLIHQLGYIPSNKKQQIIKFKNIDFDIIEIGENRIEKVVATIKSD